MLVEWAVTACRSRRHSITAVAPTPPSPGTRPAASEPPPAGEPTPTAVLKTAASAFAAAAEEAPKLNRASTSKWISAYGATAAARVPQGKSSDAAKPPTAVASRSRAVTGVGPDPMKLSFNDVSFRIDKNQVLSNVKATLRHGELVALMGESGSGKTTLLNVIAGRASYGTCTGDITFNGKPFEPSTVSLGFVPQAYLVFKELTVYENLLYTAKLRLDPKVSHEGLSPGACPILIL